MDGVTTRRRTPTAATCHPDLPLQARGLCGTCYMRASRAGTLPDHPRILRTRVEFLADYRVLRSEGYGTVRQVADRLGMQPAAVAQQLLRARKAGAL